MMLVPRPHPVPVGPLPTGAKLSTAGALLSSLTSKVCAGDSGFTRVVGCEVAYRRGALGADVDGGRAARHGGAGDRLGAGGRVAYLLDARARAVVGAELDGDVLSGPRARGVAVASTVRRGGT